MSSPLNTALASGTLVQGNAAVASGATGATAEWRSSAAAGLLLNTAAVNKLAMMAAAVAVAADTMP